MARSNSAPVRLDLIEQLSGGQLSIDWNGEPWIEIDADERNVEMDVLPVKDLTRELPRLLMSGGLGEMRQNLRVPRQLSELGWRVTLKVGKRRVAELGRGANPRTGNVHVELGALPGLLRLL